MKKVVISGVGRDKPGIVAGLTGVLYKHNCNIEDSSMTILANEFTMILIVSLPPDGSVEAMQRDFQEVEKSLGVSLFVKTLDEEPNPDNSQEEFIPVMISVAGRDQTGISYHVSRLLAKHHVNITDLNAKIIPGEDGPVYIMMVEAELSTTLDQTTLARDLQQLARELSVEIHMNPLEPITL